MRLKKKTTKLIQSCLPWAIKTYLQFYLFHVFYNSSAIFTIFTTIVWLKMIVKLLWRNSNHFVGIHLKYLPLYCSLLQCISCIIMLILYFVKTRIHTLILSDFHKYLIWCSFNAILLFLQTELKPSGRMLKTNATYLLSI